MARQHDKLREPDDFRDELVYNERVGFGYFKEEDGSYRIAIGTLAPDIVNQYTFQGGYSYDDQHQIRYWENELNDWRSCLWKNLIRTSVKILDDDDDISFVVNECKKHDKEFVKKLKFEDGQTRRFVWQKKQ